MKPDLNQTVQEIELLAVGLFAVFSSR